MQPAQDPNELQRQTALIVSIVVGLATAGVTILTFWLIYWLALAPDLAAAEAEAAAPYDPASGVQAITQASEAEIAEVQQHLDTTEADTRELWLGDEAWQAGLQAGQEYINQFPQPQNVQVLTGMNTQQIWNYMQWQVSGAMGVGCQYCHDINNYAADSYSEKVSSRLMLLLVQDLNSQYMVNLPNWRGNYVQCSTCHYNEPYGMPTVSDTFLRSTPPIDVVLEPLNDQGEPVRDPANEMSLQVATLYYLFNYQIWDPYDANDPTSGRGSLALTYPEGRTQDQVTINQNNMNLQSWALGVGCTYCHNSRNFYAYEAEQPLPQFDDTYGVNRLKSQRMLLMTTFMANNWNTYVLPPSPYSMRPTPAMDELPLVGNQYYNTYGEGDAATPLALTGCYTCHRANVVPRAAINAANIPEGEQGIWTFPPVLTGFGGE
jgi:photosynthetic reaction center cytochrome c subunit